VVLVLKEEAVFFESDGLRLAGVLRLPDHLEEPVPAILLVHGSLEQDRDGNLLETRDGKAVLKKNFFLEIAFRLCSAGFAAFSWDRRGYGESERPHEHKGYLADVRDTKAALDCLCRQKSINPQRVAVLGQSAGVYTACLLAREDQRPMAYILQGGLFCDYEEMMAFNYQRVVDYATRSPEHLSWVEEHDLYGLMIGLNFKEIESRAREGIVDHELSYKGRTWKLYHDPTCYSEELAPSRQFRYISKPALVIHGGCDLNVPVEDVKRVYEEIRARGNHEVELTIIPGVDHSFQLAATDEDLRLRERMSLQSFRRPYSDLYFAAVIGFLKRISMGGLGSRS
jgi:dipeptidyl aminopeptidase/acylaminoacyl peptidase